MTLDCAEKTNVYGRLSQTILGLNFSLKKIDIYPESCEMSYFCEIQKWVGKTWWNNFMSYIKNEMRIDCQSEKINFLCDILLGL